MTNFASSYDYIIVGGGEVAAVMLPQAWAKPELPGAFA